MAKTIQEKICDKLQTGIVTFEYRKKDGSIRYAVGTVNNNFIPAGKQTANPVSLSPTATSINYYDFTSQDWRSFKSNEMIRISAHVAR